MSLVKLLLVVVVIGVVLGLIAAYTGVLNMDKDGNVTFDKQNLDKATTASDMTKADSLALQAKPTEAIALYEAHIAKDPKGPDVPEAMFRIGKCYEDAKQEGMAIKKYKEYLAAFPNDSVDRKNRANQRISFLENAGFKAPK
jgi:tetratricopeptide (TPR) repeat protein